MLYIFQILNRNVFSFFDLNQSEGGLRCEFQMLTGLSQRKYDAPILRLKFPILITQVTNTVNY